MIKLDTMEEKRERLQRENRGNQKQKKNPVLMENGPDSDAPPSL